LGHPQLRLGECGVLSTMGALLQRSGGAGDEGSRAGSAESANPVLAGAARAFSDLVTVTRLRAASHTSLPDVSHRGGERTAREKLREAASKCATEFASLQVLPQALNNRPVTGGAELLRDSQYCRRARVDSDRNGNSSEA